MVSLDLNHHLTICFVSYFSLFVFLFSAFFDQSRVFIIVFYFLYLFIRYFMYVCMFVYMYGGSSRIERYVFYLSQFKSSNNIIPCHIEPVTIYFHFPLPSIVLLSNILHNIVTYTVNSTVHCY